MNMESSTCVELHLDDRGVATLWVDSPNRAVNVFDEAMIDDLEHAMLQLEQSVSKLRLVVLRSCKPKHFFAGADVNRIAEVTSLEEVQSVLLRGQQLFARLECLPLTTIAYVEGACMGGGLEFALACTYRVALEDRSTKLGLPEIQLGLIPGWGGTQRLPKLIGQSVALPMILQGKSLSAKDALKCGLVDRVVGNNSTEDSLLGFVSQLLAGHVPSSPKHKRSVVQSLLDGTVFGRWISKSTAIRTIKRDVPHYPALDEAINVIATGFDSHMDGFAAERAAFGRLLFTPTCRNLLKMFLNREAARRPETWTKSLAKLQPIDTVGIIGAGAMGSGIGILAAMHGHRVVLKEVDERFADMGRKRIATTLDELFRKGRLSGTDKQSLAKSMEVSHSWDCLAETDLVIEAVVEKLAVKQQVFVTVDKFTSPHTLVASNTSSLSVQAMAASTQRPTQVAGLHFFNPVHRMDLVEIVRAEQTSTDTLAQLVAFVRGLGKTPIVTADSPGFLVNRVLFPYLGEAIRMVSEGMSPVNVDCEMQDFGMPMGPIELLDQIGLDVALHVARSLPIAANETESTLRLLESLVEHGQLGKKSGNGFYTYRRNRIVSPSKQCVTLAKSIQSARGSQPTSIEWLEDGLTQVQRRLLYPLMNEAIRCLDEKIVQEAWMIDLAMVLGVGFAPFRGGPLRTFDSIGIEIVLPNMRRLQNMLGPRFTPAKGLDSMFHTGGKFLDSSSAKSSNVGVLT